MDVQSFTSATSNFPKKKCGQYTWPNPQVDDQTSH